MVCCKLRCPVGWCSQFCRFADLCCCYLSVGLGLVLVVVVLACGFGFNDL